MVSRKILVTGANQGIGLALCKSLAKDHGCHVFLGARSAEKGQEAVQMVKEYAGDAAKVDLVVIDVTSEESVEKAAKTLKDQAVTLNAIVNNAATGISHGTDSATILNCNVFGPKRVVDNFLPLLEATGSRIVNVVSGAGPMYTRHQSEERQKLLCAPDSNVTWEQIEALANGEGLMPGRKDLFPFDLPDGSYSLSKALLGAYTIMLAREHPNIMSYCLTPGYVATSMTSALPGGKKPEDALLPYMHCLFSDLGQETNGWFWGSDAKRSPLHVTRDPGTPEYDGKLPW